jgi:hypothetical protein
MVCLPKRIGVPQIDREWALDRTRQSPVALAWQTVLTAQDAALD